MALRYALCGAVTQFVRRNTSGLMRCASCQAMSVVPMTPRLSIISRTYTSFFTNSETAEDLWKGVVSVSNAGKKKGRGKRVGRKKQTDLNKGQIRGTGSANILWPGLNTQIIRGREVMTRKQLPPDPERTQELIKMRDQMSRIRHKALAPLQRGFCGSRFPGQSVGPPDPIGDYAFEGFDTRVLQLRLVSNMTGTLGRKMSFTAFVVTGNKNGLAGIGYGKSMTGKGAVRLAKNRAAQRLVYIPRFENHTVYHNMFTEYHHSRVFIHKKQKGFGLRCHRVLRACAQLIGIKDLHCKVEGNTKNVMAVAHAFFDALANQETHAELADRTGYNVVEFRKECDVMPILVAAPSPGATVAETELIDEEEDLLVDFDRLYYGGRCELVKTRPPPTLKSTRTKMGETHLLRNQTYVQLMRRAGLW